MRARRLAPAELVSLSSHELVGAILLAPVTLAGASLRKGERLDAAAAAGLIAAARQGDLRADVRIALLDRGDLHEDEAAARLARAVAGGGLEVLPPKQSRLDLAARFDGVLHVRIPALTRLNSEDQLEVFTLFHGQAVTRGDVVASVKVAPHVLAARVVEAGEAIARDSAPLIDVRPYQSLAVGAIAQEALSPEALARFEAGVRHKLEALGSRYAGTTVVGSPDPVAAEQETRVALERLVRERGLPVLLVGGVSAGDPLSPFFLALERLGGRVLRHGVPAHPGSMIWLAELDGSRILGLPQCGMFGLATAVDLILPRLLTGEAMVAADLAELAHGGVLGPTMRFRFPPYARELRAPQ
jgi:hypothetical protein